MKTPAETRIMPVSHERCWRCGGRGENISLEGFAACPDCKGTGYGESLETYWMRHGIVNPSAQTRYHQNTSTVGK